MPVKKRKRNKRPKTRSAARILRAFFLLNVLLLAGLALYGGVTYAALAGRENTDGSAPPLITWEDLLRGSAGASGQAPGEEIAP